MDKQVGLYYWRGRVLPLICKADGRMIVKLPSDLREKWRSDCRAGRIQLSH